MSKKICLKKPFFLYFRYKKILVEAQISVVLKGEIKDGYNKKEVEGYYSEGIAKVVKRKRYYFKRLVKACFKDKKSEEEILTLMAEKFFVLNQDYLVNGKTEVSRAYIKFMGRK